MNRIKIVTVIGAAGAMGSNISAIFASFGAAKVYMLDIEKPEKAIDKAVKSVRAESIRSRLIPADYSMLEKCVSESDLVFESVVENISVKKDVTKKASQFLKQGSYFCTGTSGLSINEISKVLPEELRNKYFGVHFFNPPYNMTLCELIKTDLSEQADVDFLKDYLSKQLLRTVVVCKDKPAFVGNRIGFQFINAALQLADRYANEGGLDYIDAIFGTFTGRLMAPCNTADFVGLDVHKAIIDNLFTNTDDYEKQSYVLPNYLIELIDNKKLGRKSGEGLFKLQINEDGTKIPLVYDIQSKQFRAKNKYMFVFAEKMKIHLKNGEYKLAFDALKEDNSQEAMICKDLLKRYIRYALFVSQEVCDNESGVDDAMATGFGWCPPLALSNALFDTNYSTNYDYRSFFKAGK